MKLGLLSALLLLGSSTVVALPAKRDDEISTLKRRAPQGGGWGNTHPGYGHQGGGGLYFGHHNGGSGYGGSGYGGSGYGGDPHGQPHGNPQGMGYGGGQGHPGSYHPGRNEHPYGGHPGYGGHAGYGGHPGYGSGGMGPHPHGGYGSGYGAGHFPHGGGVAPGRSIPDGHRWTVSRSQKAQYDWLRQHGTPAQRALFRNQIASNKQAGHQNTADALKRAHASATDPHMKAHLAAQIDHHQGLADHWGSKAKLHGDRHARLSGHGGGGR